jgi:hypothetical protein
MSMQKRQREHKRDKKADRGNDVASANDLADYGAAPAPFGDASED